MATKTRNRVIYQSEALYVGQPSATGHHVNATHADAPGKLFGLVKHPASIDELCAFDWTENWQSISKPVDREISEFEISKLYKAKEITKVTESTGKDAGKEFFFICTKDVDPDNPNADDVYKISSASYDALFEDNAPSAFTANTDTRNETGNDSMSATDWASAPDTISYTKVAGATADAQDSLTYAEWNALPAFADAATSTDGKDNYETVLSKQDADPVIFDAGGNQVALFADGLEAKQQITEASFDALPEDEYVLISSDTAYATITSKSTADYDAAGKAATLDQAGYDSLTSGQDHYIRRPVVADFSLDVTGSDFQGSSPIVSLKDFTYNGTYDFSNSVLTDWDIKYATKQLHRVQSANYSFAFNRQDVNQFGQLHRIDSVAIDPPTVSLDFSYYITNGSNERLMGFHVNTYEDMLDNIAKNFVNMKKEEDDFEGRNYFILTTPQGEDATKNNAWENGYPKDDSGHSTISLGNGYVTNYGVEAAVGSMPTASITVEGINLKSDTGFHNVEIPAVDNSRGTPIESVSFSLPAPVSGVFDDGIAPDEHLDGDLYTGQTDGFSCLRPGDIEMHLGTAGGAALMTNLPDGTPPHDTTVASCHIQSFSIDIPMGRTPLQRLGTPYAYTRPLDLPIQVTINISAIASDLKSGNIAENLFNFENHDLQFILREPQIDGAGPIAMAFFAKGAQIDGESFSSSIGDNKTVDLTFTCQIGGAEDTTRGLMVSGSRGGIPNTDKDIDGNDPDSSSKAAQDYLSYPLIDRFDPATK